VQGEQVEVDDGGPYMTDDTGVEHEGTAAGQLLHLLKLCRLTCPSMYVTLIPGGTMLSNLISVKLCSALTQALAM